MHHSLSRRHFTLGLAALSALGTAGGLALRLDPGARAIVVGGGPAGAEAALTLAAANPRASVLLVERDPARLARAAAPVAAFAPPQADVTLSALRAAGVEVVLDDVTGVDWTAARLALFSGRSLAFDRLVMAPGTAPRPETIAGLDARTRHEWPAAWGSAREARRLSAQLAALPEGGHVVLRLPAEVSHPQVALARAVTLAGAVAARPRARLTVLDATGTDRLARAFADVVPAGATVAWHGAGKGGVVRAVDARRGLIETDAGALRADVVNFVPPLMAGAIAQGAGLADASGWCPCDGQGRSDLRTAALVLGDARKAARRTLADARRSAQVLAG
ncbi:FAD-dependent oxidoreductase [Phaeovulum vinaykumarii]|uniref:Pyridine nucleotide-disulphide oxidoreductase n=1 Tax=Phaeovulum vinaykumarii TaxID=407234 RepID=A0A1N7M7A4_9RHOB|nr:FAD-dependent oxidoreductase [Phaeovulum vinaykumarii]SIS81985.1 Pyridine nucleotide-disulphide oxidoreductase [Phaeovulum vinaykumarii]SOC11262.1 pyridine nucleotide-disulphide oxidoreductase [Phaeovulum vinaykumarii]